MADNPVNMYIGEPHILLEQQVKGDIKQCMHYLYNNQNHPLGNLAAHNPEYLESLIRLSNRLKKGAQQTPRQNLHSKGDLYQTHVTPEYVFQLIISCVKDCMDGIRIRVEKEMARIGITQRVPPSRPQSFDDYFLLNNVGSTERCNLQHQTSQSLKTQFCNPYHPHQVQWPVNNFVALGQQLLTQGRKYEQCRRQTRQDMALTLRSNRLRLLNFSAIPAAYLHVFKMILGAYNQLKEGWLGLEEVWIYIVESVFGQEQAGSLIFESQHKFLFRRYVIESKFISEFIREVSTQYDNLCSFEERQAALGDKKTSLFNVETSLILGETYNILLKLDEELQEGDGEDLSVDARSYDDEFHVEDDANFYGYSRAEISTGVNPSSGQGSECLKSGEHYSQDVHQKNHGCKRPQTYEQLRDTINHRYGGNSLSQLVLKFDDAQKDDQNTTPGVIAAIILKHLEREQKCAQLMQNIPRFDPETLAFLIEHKISASQCEELLNKQLQKQVQQNQSKLQDKAQSQLEATQRKVNPFKPRGNSYKSDDSQNEEDQVKERKKTKNRKKKRKRKEKKFQQEQNQKRESIWQAGLQQELVERYEETRLDCPAEGPDTQNIEEQNMKNIKYDIDNKAHTDSTVAQKLINEAEKSKNKDLDCDKISRNLKESESNAFKAKAGKNKQKPSKGQVNQQFEAQRVDNEAKSPFSSPKISNDTSSQRTFSRDSSSFERELVNFQNRLDQNGLASVDLSNVKKRTEISSPKQRSCANKLVPNVQPEWIESVQRRLSELERQLISIQLAENALQIKKGSKNKSRDTSATNASSAGRGGFYSPRQISENTSLAMQSLIFARSSKIQSASKEEQQYFLQKGMEHQSPGVACYSERSDQESNIDLNKQKIDGPSSDNSRDYRVSHHQHLDQRSA